MILETVILVECDCCGNEEEISFPNLPSETAVRMHLESECAWKCTMFKSMCDICYHAELDEEAEEDEDDDDWELDEEFDDE